MTGYRLLVTDDWESVSSPSHSDISCPPLRGGRANNLDRMLPPVRIAVVGTGYVGLVTAVVLADLGYVVTGVDRDKKKLGLLEKGISPIYEPGLEDVLHRAQSNGTIDFTDDLTVAVGEADVVFIAVGTPAKPDGNPDMSAVEAVAAEIGRSIRGYTVIVNKSTVPVGSGRLVRRIIVEQGASPEDFDVVSNPEFLREGTAVRDTVEADRIVIGASNPVAAKILKDVYAPLARPVMITDVESAELIKYASNSFLAMKISFINAISQLCERCGANVDEVARGMGSDPRIGSSFLQAGLGWGGSCFPKDVQGLMKISKGLGYRFGLLEEVDAINDEQTHRFVDRLEKRLGGFHGKRIALWGLAFKPNTDDIRDAKSLVIIDRVLKSGGQVFAYDPIAMDNVRGVFPQVHYTCNAFQAAEDADALLLVTEWDEFRHLNLPAVASSMRQPVLFDGRRLYTRDLAAGAGFEYHTIGEAIVATAVVNSSEAVAA